MRALIVGPAAARGAIAAARALQGSGWIVGIGSPTRGPVAGTRSAQRVHQVPPPHDAKRFLKAVNGAIHAGGYEVIFGSGDAEVLTLSAMRKGVHGIFPYPQHERLLEVLDKSRLAAAARAAGLSTPTAIEATADALSEARYPVIVKPRLHWSPENGGAPVRIEAEIATSTEDALRIVRSLLERGGAPFVQEILSGDLLAYTVLVGHGSEVIMDVQQRANRLWPPGSGVSVRARTEPVDPWLREQVGRLLRHCEWFGLAQLQFIASADGAVHLIDLNGRFYGSLALALAAGSDLVSGWANLATGRPVEVAKARVGTRYQWLEGDVRRAVVERRGGLTEDLASCLRYAHGAVHSVWNIRDPGPALFYVTSLSGRFLRKVVR